MRAGDTTPAACCSSLLQYRIARSQVNATLLNADLGDVAFFDNADDTASRGLRTDMIDVFALAGAVATNIIKHAR